MENVDALDKALKYDINKWAKKSVGASYQLNKKATLYYKVSSQALLPSLRSIGQLITIDDGSANDLDDKTLKKFAEFDENAKRYVLTYIFCNIQLNPYVKLVHSHISVPAKRLST